MSKALKGMMKNSNWYALITLPFIVLWLWPWVDYFDLGLWPGINVFNKPVDLTALVTWTVGLPAATTLIAAIYNFREQQRQRLLELRPYLRVAWESGFIGENRRPQGISDTCLLLINEGRGLMVDVRYKIHANDKEVGVRDHALISSNHCPTRVVYDDLTNKTGSSLGCPNDPNLVPMNNEIIRTSSIVIEGSYKDIEGGEYPFGFKSDQNQQSWFRETKVQKRP